jgi:hypothetical protein
MTSPNVSIVFDTDDGRVATALQVTSGLATLPAGWSAAAPSFSCATLSSGSGCELNLTYTPGAAAAGTLMLGYSYENNANQTKTGTISIPYRATTNDTVVGTPTLPSVAVITGSSAGVTVAFATNDGNPASNLAITSGLSPLPAGWSSTSATFSCTTVSDGTVCQLRLTYAPTAVDSGTLTLGYSYLNDAGFAKTGTVNIGYRANSDDTVGAVFNPTSLSMPAGSGSQSVTLTFTTSDGAPASGLSVTSGLSALPAGWSGTSTTFNCATVSDGTLCQLTLTYTPTVPAVGTIPLTYSYTDNAGVPKTGATSLSFTAT